MKKLTILTVLIFLFTACNKEDEQNDDCKNGNYTFPEFESNQTAFDDCDLLNAAYTHYYTPPDFYEESDESRYYENTVSIGIYDNDNPEWIELCTDSLELAHAWSETSAVRSSYYRVITSERETEKFFEFRRVREENQNDVILSRVHKCNYLDRTMYDYFNPDSLLGIYNMRPINIDRGKELAEYLWLNSHLIGKVLSSYIAEKDEYLEHTFYEL